MKLDDGTETCSHEYVMLHSKNVPAFMQLDAQLRAAIERSEAAT
jgi:hypothetical protein